ncbi:protein of unknown function [Thauera humireducens]|nr:protein of unknown function [Thauera humireducens]
MRTTRPGDIPSATSRRRERSRRCLDFESASLALFARLRFNRFIPELIEGDHLVPLHRPPSESDACARHRTARPVAQAAR